MEQSQQSMLFRRDSEPGVGGGFTSQQSTSSLAEDVVDDDDNDTSGDDTLIFHVLFFDLAVVRPIRVQIELKSQLKFFFSMR